jgi:hypothetical protein
MSQSTKSHEYDDHCSCMDCCSSPERIEHIIKDAERQHHTFKDYVQDHMPQLSLVIIVAYVLLFFV